MTTDMGRETAPGMVIERIIGTLSVRAASENASNVPYTAAIRVVPEGDTGLTLVPDTEIGRWLWWYGTQLTTLATESAAGVFRAMWDAPVTFDVHGRWKLDNVSDTLRFMLVNHDAEDDLIWSLWTRTLLRIP